MKQKMTTKLKAALDSDELIVASAVYNAIGARVLEQAGVKVVTLSGNTTSANLLGMPDMSLLSCTDMVSQARYIAAAIDIPLICDADTGYGGVHNVMQTVHEFESAGVAGIHIEDQLFPKRCGFMKGVEVVPREEAVTRYQAAVAARTDPNFLIIARTDARTPLGLDEAIERANLYLEAGADMAYVEGLKSFEEVQAVAERVKGPKFYSATEYRPWTNCSRKLIKEMGYKLANYPMTLTLTLTKQMMEFAAKFVSADSTQEFVPGMADMHSEYEAILNLPKFYEAEMKLARK